MNIKEKLRISNNVVLVGASKKQSVSKIQDGINYGLKIIGENYVDEAYEKYKVLKGKVKFHMIGHLQSNKVKKALEIFDMIQTLDSLKLAEKINETVLSPYPVLIQVNIGKESQKHGVDPDELDNFVNELRKYKKLDVKGLMCIAPSNNPRSYFKQMFKLFKKYDYDILSMGMSQSYLVAIEEGANMVRVGTGLFGSRN